MYGRLSFRRPRSRRAFSLVEMLVSIAVLVLLLGVVFTTLTETTTTIQTASSSANAFESSRIAFDILSQKLAQATLNTYWAYDNPTTPTKYVRKSDLDFVIQANGNYGQQISFQAPLAYSDNADYASSGGLLNACNYEVVYGVDDSVRPSFVATKRYRYRLMQAIQPAQSLAVFSASLDGWIAGLAQWNWPLVDNVVALVLWPRLSRDADSAGTQISSNYLYNSRSGSSIQLSRLPPSLMITLITVDEKSMTRLNPTATPPTVIEAALRNRFTDVTKYQTDVDSIKAAFDAAHIRYEVITGSVTMKESEWSSTP